MNKHLTLDHCGGGALARQLHRSRANLKQLDVTELVAVRMANAGAEVMQFRQTGITSSSSPVGRSDLWSPVVSVPIRIGLSTGIRSCLGTGA